MGSIWSRQWKSDVYKIIQIFSDKDPVCWISVVIFTVPTVNSAVNLFNCEIGLAKAERTERGSDLVAVRNDLDHQWEAESNGKREADTAF